MNNSSTENENIQLTLPINPSYVSAARLTASSIANRVGFDIDEIEDIKAAVSEACTFIIKKLSNGDFTLHFSVSQGVLNIVLSTKGEVSLVPDEDEMGLLMIRALMDKLQIEKNSENVTVITMEKTHKVISFE